MAVIQKIQKQTGCLLLVIGVAMIAFVLTDLISTRSSIFGGNANTVAEIKGEKIDYTDLNNRYEGMINDLRLNNPDVEVTEEIRQAYQEQAWNQLIQEKVMEKEYAKLGLAVSGKELADITVGDNTHPRVKQAFTDQQTGVFDKNRFVKFIQEDIEADEELKYKWLNFFEDPIKDEIIGQKYSTLLRSALYVNKLDAETDYIDNNFAVSASMVGIPYTSISDSAVKYDDSDLKAYLRSNAKKYEQKASADIDFVLFNVIPSSKDSNEVKTWAEGNVEKFKKAANDSTFVEIMGSETFFNNQFVNRGSFPTEVENILFSADSGTVAGPFYNNGKWSVYKVSAVANDSVSSMKASHILVPVMGQTMADTLAAVAKARTLMAEINSGTKNFDEEAARNFDGTAMNKGDFGWIKENANSPSEKLIKELFRHAQGDMYVTTDPNGVHIVKVTGGKTRRQIKVAVLDRTIEAGNATDQEAYKLAGELASLANTNKDFEKVIEGKGYTKRVADRIQEGDKNVPGIKNTTPILRWLFDDDTKKGSVSDVLEVDGKYMVAKCRMKRKAGAPELDDVREALIPEVIKEKKAERIAEKFEKALKSAKSIDALAKALNVDVQDIPNQTFGSAYVPFAGNDPLVLGTIFGLKEKKLSSILKGELGVYVVVKTGVAPQQQLPNIADAQRAMTDELKGRSEGQILESLRTAADIKDFRYKYF